MEQNPKPQRKTFNNSFFVNKKSYIFDVEADGLYREATKIHCIVIKDYNTKEVFKYSPDQLEQAFDKLKEADFLIGHNIVDYDLRLINKLYPNIVLTAKAVDTLVLSRLIFANIAKLDAKQIALGTLKKEFFKVWDRETKTEVSAIGRHSIEAWGLRLGNYKDKFGRDTDWSTYTPEMLEYCAKDVEVNFELFRRLVEKDYLLEPVNLECKVQPIITEQIATGWAFDVEAGQALLAKLLQKQHELTQLLQSEFKGWQLETKTPEYYYANIDGKDWKADTKGELSKLLWGFYKENFKRKELESLIHASPVRKKYIAFNPASRVHVFKVLSEKYGWKPKYYNEDGTAKVDSTVLETLPYPEAKILLEYEVVKDRLEKLLGSKQKKKQTKGWLESVIDGRIHGYCNPLGASTNRGSHRDPNLAQVPASYSPYGKECRSLFIAPEGYSLVGTDASSQELRCLAHNLYQYDKGKYARAVVQGNKEQGTDPHSMFMKAAGLKDRDTAKTTLYAYLYGAGDLKLAKTAETGKYTASEGKRIRSVLHNEFFGLGTLENNLKSQVERYYRIYTLDGRPIYCKSPHAALNFLLQSTGAILTKRWMVIINSKFKEAGFDKSIVAQVGWIHDEIQFQVANGYEEQVGKICVDSMKEVEKYYNFKCPLDAEFKVGKNWQETH